MIKRILTLVCLTHCIALRLRNIGDESSLMQDLLLVNNSVTLGPAATFLVPVLQGMIANTAGAAFGNIMNSIGTALDTVGLGFLDDPLCFIGIGSSNCLGGAGPSNQDVMDAVGQNTQLLHGVKQDLKDMDLLLRTKFSDLEAQFEKGQKETRELCGKNYKAITDGFAETKTLVEDEGKKTYAKIDELYVAQRRDDCRDYAINITRVYERYVRDLGYVRDEAEKSDKAWSDRLKRFADTWSTYHAREQADADLHFYTECFLENPADSYDGLFSKLVDSFLICQTNCKKPWQYLEELFKTYEYVISVMIMADELVYTTEYQYEDREVADTERQAFMDLHKYATVKVAGHQARRGTMTQQFWKAAKKLRANSDFPCVAQYTTLHTQNNVRGKNYECPLHSQDCMDLKYWIDIWYDRESRYPASMKIDSDRSLPSGVRKWHDSYGCHAYQGQACSSSWHRDSVYGKSLVERKRCELVSSPYQYSGGGYG